MSPRSPTDSTAGIGIVYATHRPEPRLDWFVESLAAQLDDDELELVVVDGLFSAERMAQLDRVVGERFPLRHVPPKPSPYNGAHRRTRVDLFAAASARNTGVVHTRKPYLVFVDDCSVVSPGWLAAVREHAEEGRVVSGAYEKRREMVVERGAIVHSKLDQSGIDSRALLAEGGELVQIVGGQLYGASFGLPRALMLDVNGLDELCDPMGGEDYQLGIRLEWAGAPVFYDRRMLTVEAHTLERHGETPRRLGRTLAPEAYLAKLAEFGISERSTDGEYDNSHMVLDILYGTRETQAIGNDYNLALLAPDDLPGLAAGLPDAYWFDGTPLEQL